LSPFQVTFGGGSDVVTDAFVTKLNTSAAAITYSSYLGGSNNDFGKGIAVDPNGSVYVVGLTGSGDFPTAAAVTTSRPGLLDAFIAKISDTNTISYSISPRVDCPERRREVQPAFRPDTHGSSPAAAVRHLQE